MAILRLDTESLNVQTFEVSNAASEPDLAGDNVNAATVAGCPQTRNICVCQPTGCC